MVFSFMRVKKIIFPIFLFSCKFCFAQNQRIDSLKSVLKNSTEDTNKVIALYKLAAQFQNNNPDTTMILNRQSLVLAEKLNYKKGIANALTDIGFIHRLYGNYDSAIYFLESGLNIHKIINNRKGISSCLGALAIVYISLGNYPKAFESSFRGIKIDEETGNKAALARKLHNVGIIYKEQGNTGKAI
jgi:tetratricopeptide (TPR) repeat protein